MEIYIVLITFIIIVLIYLFIKTEKISSNERKITAYHEAAHFVVAMAQQDAVLKNIKVKKYCFRNNEKGYVNVRVPSYIHNRNEQRIKITLAGKVAEQLIFHDYINDGCYSDTVFVNNLLNELNV